MRRFATLFIALFAGSLAFAQAPAAAGAGGPKPKSQAENDAINAIFKAQDMPGRVKAAETFLATYDDSDYKSTVLFVLADAYQEGRDSVKAVSYGERAITADPKNVDALLLVANVIAETTRPGDLDVTERLAKVDKYATSAIAIIPGRPKPNPQVTDAQWDEQNKQNLSQAYQAMGTANVGRKKYADAVASFQKGIDAYPDPLIMLRAGRAELAAGNFDKAIAWDDKAANVPGADPAIKKYAASDKAAAEGAKKK